MEMISQLRLSDSRSIKLTDQEAFGTFYQLLCCSKETWQLLLPETIVWGWGIDVPSLLFTNEEGRLSVIENINSEQLQSFLMVCRKHQQVSSSASPACVARTQQGTSLVFDTKAAMCLWHRNQVEGSPIMLQRYVASDESCSKVTRVHWTHLKTEKTILESPISQQEEPSRDKMLSRLKTSAFMVKTMLKRPSRASAHDDPRFLLKFASAKKTYDNSKVPELDAQLSVLFSILRHQERKLEANLMVLVANFVKSRDGLWYLINVEHLLFSKHTQLQIKEVKPNSAVHSRYRETPSKSQTAPRGKRPLRPNSRKPTIRQLAERTKRIPSSSPSSSSNKGDLNSLHIKLKEMPPLFTFPTPRIRPVTSETFLTVPKDLGFSDYVMTSTLPLMSYNFDERLLKIREHIERQNNSLFARIHYCEEHASTKQHRDAVGNSISRVARIYDKVRARAKLLSQSFTG